MKVKGRVRFMELLSTEQRMGKEKEPGRTGDGGRRLSEESGKEKG